MSTFLERLLGIQEPQGRPAGAWLRAKQEAPVWGEVKSLRIVPRPARPYDWEEES